MKNLLILLLLALFSLTGCASKEKTDMIAASAEVAPLSDTAFEDYDSEEADSIADPLEPWNRFWFGFNDVLMTRIISPIYSGYEAITPSELRLGLSNAYHNLQTPIRLANSLLQGEFARAWIEVGRFVVNSTLGAGGLIDITKDNKPLVPIDSADPDLGQTLGKWGVGEGFYLVWPFFGPSTMRDSVGLAGDAAVSPFAWLVEPWGQIPFWPGVGADVALRFNAIKPQIETYQSLTGSAIEPYSAVRDAYVKYRRSLVRRAQ